MNNLLKQPIITDWKWGSHKQCALASDWIDGEKQVSFELKTQKVVRILIWGQSATWDIGKK